MVVPTSIQPNTRKKPDNLICGAERISANPMTKRAKSSSKWACKDLAKVASKRFAFSGLTIETAPRTTR